jgi:hypothetical protein
MSYFEKYHKYKQKYIAAKSTVQAGGGGRKKISFFFALPNPSPGLRKDAETLVEAFKTNGYSGAKMDIDIYEQENQTSYTKYSHIVFIETLPRLYSYPKKQQVIFLPNYEFLHDAVNLDKVDWVLSKTKQTLDFMENLKKTSRFTYGNIYIGFTTPYAAKTVKVLKDPNVFVHLAGKSMYKNTSVLVKAWLDNGGFLDIDPNIQLHITCYSWCIGKLIRIMKREYGIDIPHKGNVYKWKNLTLYKTKVEGGQFKRLLESAVLAICPSMAEGFGYYIHESMYHKTAVLAINAPPTNEVVTEDNGFLLKKFDKSPIKESHLGQSYLYPNVKALGKLLHDIIKNKNILRDKGINAGKTYARLQKEFKETFAKHAKDIVESKNVTS